MSSVGVLSPTSLTRQLHELGSGKFLADPISALIKGIKRFKPPEKVRTVDWATENRKFKLADSGAIVQYDPKRTPYNLGFSDALDDPTVQLAVMVKPSRSGGTATVENYLGKLIDIGPFPRTAWILGSDKAVKEYVEGVIKDLFELHPRLAAKIGTDRSDNTDTRKRISGQLLEFLASNDATYRNREFGFGVMDEPDGWKQFSETPKVQLEGRQKNLGRRRKGVILSHPDKGWRAGVAAAWEQTSRGIFILRCPDCGGFAASYASKFWKNVPEFKLTYSKTVEGKAKQDLTGDERLALAEKTAGLACPHCGVVHDDEARDAMVDEAGEAGWWMHRGQTLDHDLGIQGQPDPHHERGFWVHGTVVKTSPLSTLARGLEEALIRFERSGGSRQMTKVLREYHSKQLGEIFEGKSALGGVDAAQLEKRTKALAEEEDSNPFAYRMGEVPPGVLFLTAAVDVGGGKFDLLVRGWDRARRSWIIDRRTIRQREHANGIMRDIAPPDVQDDWNVLEPEIDRLYPLRDDPDKALPIAVMTIDAGDGNVTWKAYEFARRMDHKRWAAWQKVRCIKGASSPKAPAMPVRPTDIAKDSEGRPIKPVITLHTLGVHELKEQALEDVAVKDGSPGMVIFPTDFPRRAYEEIFNEPLIDGKFERQGPQETLDLLGYSEGSRLMLEPDRDNIVWDQGIEMRPIWAQPVLLSQPKPEQAAPKARAKHRSIFEQFDALNEED